MDAAWKTTCDTGVDGFKIYRPVDPSAGSKVKRAKKEKPLPSTNWSARAAHFASRLDTHARQRLALTLGVPAESTRCVPMLGASGDTTAGLIVTFPEVDADGVTVGIMERDPSRPSRGEKSHKSMAGGNRGVTPTVGWDAPTESPLLLVEGGSGALAAAGIPVLGRPGAENRTAVGYLAEMIRKLPPTRRVIVVGVMNRKVNDKGEEEWPGRDGMLSTADQLVAAGVPNPVFAAIMPNLFGDAKPLKDVRDGLTDSRHGEKPWYQRGAEVLAAVEAVAVRRERTADTQPNTEYAGEYAGHDDDPERWAVENTDAHRLARAFLATLSPPDSPLQLRYWRGEFHEWRAGCYHAIDGDFMEGRLSNWLNEEFHRVYRLTLHSRIRKGKSAPTKPLKVQPVTRRIVNDTLGAMQGICQAGLDMGTEAPRWLDGATGPVPTDIVVCRNGMVDTATGELLPLTPTFFTLNAVPYDYDPAAPTPPRWTQFLAEVWPDDPDSARCLQEWFGYLLTGDNSQQKMLYLFGDTRCSKGTAARLLRASIGERNVTPTSYKSLDGDFGLWPLLGKSVAVMGDSRSLRGDEIGDNALERILNITGQDAILVNRKGISMVPATLSTRLVILSNDLPCVTDTSGAFVSRIVLLHFRQSFLGREDTDLTNKLLAELPGVLNWSLEGLRRLRARGRFVQPATGAAKLNLVRAGASPIGEFVTERCKFGEAFSVPCKDLFEAWVKWCGENGRKEPGTAQSFGIRLSSVPGGSRIERSKKTAGGERPWCYSGLRLRDAFEGDDPEPCPDSPAEVGAKAGRESGHLRASVVESVRGASGDGRSTCECPNCCPDFAPTSAASRGSGNACRSSHLRHSAPAAPTFQEVLRLEEENGPPSFLYAAPSVIYVTDFAESRGSRGTPDQDLYFTADLALVSYPTGTACDVIQDGPATAYKVTPDVAVSLIATLDRAPAGSDRDRLKAALDPICDYLVRRYSPEEIAAAEARGPQPLPTLPTITP